MLAGSLEIQLLADVARLRADFQQAQRIVSSGVQSMERALDDLRGAFGGLFAGASVAGFAVWTKSAIDFADSLDDLRASTNLSIKDLSGLQLAAKIGGSELGTVASSVRKLSLEMGKDSERFRAIGITAKEPLEAFKQLSDVFRGIEDPQLRAAVAAGALGKSWADVAPLLERGGTEIQRLMDRGNELAPVTKELSDLSGDFNDSLDELRIALQGNALTISTSALPLLTELAKSLTDVSVEARGTDVGFSILTETMRAVIVFGGNVAFVVHGIATELGGMAAQAAALMRGDFTQFAEIGKTMKADAAARRQAFDEWEARMMAAGKASAGAAQMTHDAFRRMEHSAGSANVAALKNFVDDGAAAKKLAEAAKKAAEQYDALMSKIKERLHQADQELSLGRKLTEAEKFEIQMLEQLASAKLKLTPAQLAVIKNGLEEVKVREAQVAAQKARIKWLQHEAEVMAEWADDESKAYVDASKAREQYSLATLAESRSLDDANDQLEAEAKLLGATTKQRQIAIDHLRIEQKLRKDLQELEQNSAFNGFDSSREIERQRLIANANAARDQATRRADLGEMVELHQKQIDLLKGTDDIARDVFVNIASEGEDAFKAIGRSIKANLYNLLYQLTLRPFVIQIAGTALGANPAAIQQAIGVAGTGAVQGGASALAGSWLTGSTGGFGQALGATMQNGMIGGFGANMTNISTLAGGGQFLPALGAAAPYLAAAVGIASLLSGAFKGETRVGGQYFDTAFQQGPSGGAIAGATEAIAGTITAINNALAGLGATTRLESLVSGLEQSERGKGFAYAGGYLSNGAAFGQGTDGRGYMNRRGDMTSEQALAAFGEELKQATLQALQAADVPGQLGEYLRSLGDIDALSGGALDKALNTVNSVAAFTASVANLGGAFAQLGNLSVEARDAMIEAAGGLEAITSATNAYVSAMFTAEEQRDFAWKGLVKTFRDMGLVLPSTHAEFKALVNTLVEQGSPLAGAVMAVSGAFAQVYGTAQDAADAISQVAPSLTQLVQGLRSPVRTLEDIAQNLVRMEGDANSLSMEIMRANGDIAGADALRRKIETAGLTDAEIAHYDYVESLRAHLNAINATKQAGDNLVNVYRQQEATLKETIQRHQQYAQQLRNVRDALYLGEGSPLSGALRTASAEAKFNDTLQAAQAGNIEAIEKLQADGTGYLAALEASALTREQYNAGVARVAAGLTITAAKSDSIVTAAQMEITRMEQQLTVLGLLKDVTKTGFDQLLAAFVAQRNAIQTPAVPAPSGGGGGGGASDSLSQLFGHYLGRAPTASDYAYYSGWSDTQIATGVLNSAEYAAIRGYAVGGLASGLALVGERGPELVDFESPGRVYTAEQTRGMFGGSAEVVYELRSLRGELAALREDDRYGTSTLTSKLSSIDETLTKIDRVGTEKPLKVQVIS